MPQKQQQRNFNMYVHKHDCTASFSPSNISAYLCNIQGLPLDKQEQELSW